jgi:FtsP/CotA-like multicopper oxidase with cupredoxin domain
MVTFTPETLILAKVTIDAIEPVLPVKLRTLTEMGAVTATKEVTFSEMGMNHMMGQMQGGGMGQSQMMMTGMFYINGKSFDMNRIDMTSKVGEVEEWLLINNSHMDHPFHLHGTQFEVIAHLNNGKTTAPAYRARKDTVNLRPNEQVRIKTVQNSKGMRMFHCHILEHEAVGMMAQLMVV